MQMRGLRATIILAVMCVAGMAAAQDVRYNFDSKTDFSKFKTYKWVVLKDAQKVDNLVDSQIKDTIDAELAKKGLSKIDADSADLYVGYQVAVGTEKQYTSFSSDWGYGPGWYGGGWYGGGGMGSSTTTGSTSTIYNGQLALDMYDSQGHDLVWRGVATKSLDPKAKPDKRQKNLTKAVAKMLKNYPPPVKK
jgi:hypothetical protein